MCVCVYVYIYLYIYRYIYIFSFSPYNNLRGNVLMSGLEIRKSWHREVLNMINITQVVDVPSVTPFSL